MSKIAGSPGPMPPPKWLRDVESVVGVGEENGVAYVDIKKSLQVIAFIEDGALWIGEAGEFGLAAIEQYRAKHGHAPVLLTLEEVKRLTTS